MSRPGGGKGSFFWEASPSTYPLIGKSRDLLPTGRDRTANLLAPDCQSYLFFAREVYEASLHWGDSDPLLLPVLNQEPHQAITQEICPVLIFILLLKPLTRKTAIATPSKTGNP